MKRKNKQKLILLIGLFVLLNFFMSKQINFKLENIIKNIVMFPYNRVILEHNLDKDKNFINSELKNKDKEIKELKELLNLKTINSMYEIINATIINRSMEYFYDEVIIDKGSNEGIKKNMAVVTNNGLVGKTKTVNKNNTVIKLITSADLYNMLSVQIEVKDGFIYGILNGYDKETNSFVIEGIDQNVKIDEGSLVSTTGLANTFPSGIVVGKVVRIQKDNFDLAYILKVEPNIEFDNFNYVAVLNKIND